MQPYKKPNLSESEETDFQPLTSVEAKILRNGLRLVSPWFVVGLQLTVGVVVALIAWFLSDSKAVALSSAYGSLAVVIPAAVFVRGLSRQKRVLNAGSALGGFFVWEVVKIALTVVMLFAAPRVVLDLSWLALLANFVVTMKVYWVAMWLHSRRSDSIA